MNEKFLVVKLGALGDLFYAVDVPTILKSHFPTCEVTWLVGENLKSAVGAVPHVDQVKTIRDQNMKTSLIQKILFFFRLRSFARKNQFSSVFVFHRNPGFAWAFWGLTKSVYQITREHGKKFAAHHPVPTPPMVRHEANAYRDVVHFFLRGQKQVPREKTFISAPSVRRSQSIVIHVGGGQNGQTEFILKQYPRTREIIEKLLESSAKHRLVLVGSPVDRSEPLLEELAKNPRVEDRVGRTSLVELIQIIRSAQLLIGVDSGPLHIADAFGVPCVGIYGPTSPVSWGLRGQMSRAIFHSVPCQPCYRDDGFFPPCPNHHVCMTGLGVDKIVESATKLIQDLGDLQ